MPDLPLRAEYFKIGADEIQSRSEARPPGQRISPEQVYTEGSDVNIVNASSSAMAEEVTRQLGTGLQILLLDGARGPDLDRLVADRFSPTIVRKQATPAVATLSLTRVTGALPGGTLPIGTRVRTRNGIEFKTTAPASLPPGSTGPVTVLAEASIAGIGGNVDENTLVTFAEPPFDPNIQVTNPQVAAGGDDTETDPRLRARARDFFRTVRRGTLGAIEFGALTVGGVRQATAIELIDSLGIPTGHVQLLIADALGQANDALVTAVRAALLEWRAAGVVVDIVATVPQLVEIRYLLRFSAATNTTQASDAIRVATVAAVNALRPGETLTVSLLFSIARSVAGVIVLDDAVVAPVGDLVPEPGKTIRTRADLVTFV